MEVGTKSEGHFVHVPSLRCLSRSCLRSSTGRRFLHVLNKIEHRSEIKSFSSNSRQLLFAAMSTDAPNKLKIAVVGAGLVSHCRFAICYVSDQTPVLERK